MFYSWRADSAKALLITSGDYEQFLMQVTHKSKPGNNAGFTKWLEILVGEDFPSKLLWSENADMKLSSNKGEKDDNKKPAEQREHRFAQRRKRRLQETEESFHSRRKESI